MFPTKEWYNSKLFITKADSELLNLYVFKLHRYISIRDMIACKTKITIDDPIFENSNI